MVLQFSKMTNRWIVPITPENVLPPRPIIFPRRRLLQEEGKLEQSRGTGDVLPFPDISNSLLHDLGLSPSPADQIGQLEQELLLGGTNQSSSNPGRHVDTGLHADS